MLFVWIGFMKAGEAVPPSVQHQTNDFLQQPFIPIRSVGPLLDKKGGRAGMMMMFESDDREKAEAFVAGSPYLKAGLYDEHHLYEYRNEV